MPGLIDPESQSKEPSDLVVCGTVSLFTQTTVSPALIAMIWGEKLALVMTTVLATGAGTMVVLGFGVVVEGLMTVPLFVVAWLGEVPPTVAALLEVAVRGVVVAAFGSASAPVCDGAGLLPKHPAPNKHKLLSVTKTLIFKS